MNIALPVRAAAIGILASLLLTACSTPSTNGSEGGSSQSESAATPQTEPDTRQVIALEVVDPVTVVVTPKVETDELYGEEFTVHLNDIATPAQGECGYDQVLAEAENTLVDHTWFLSYGTVADGVYVDPEGDHHGRLDSRSGGYGLTLINKGLAWLPSDDADQLNYGQYQDAKDAAVGLWGTCDDFGA